MNFKNIPNKYRPIPFWSWNDRLNVSETKQQIEEMHDAGLGGYFMHARGGLQTEYMGEEWFENIEASITQGAKLNMDAWAYDENGWPSGFGNGIVNSMGVEFQQKSIKFEKGEKHTPTTIANINGYHYFYEANPFYVDLLDKKVVRTFIESIYEPYYEKFKTKIKGFFTDEPQLVRDAIPWSLVLPDEYQKEYGESLLEKLPHLFFEIDDYYDTRIKFWRLITKLFSESFGKQVYDWCEEKGLKLTGHMILEENLYIQLTANGAIMPHYEYFHIPGMDSLGRQKIVKPAMLQVSSVAQQLGKKQVLSETFALTGWNVSFEEMKSIYEWQMVRGVNLLCTHLAAYSLRGIRKRDYPAAFSYQQPWWKFYNSFIDTVSRIGMLLSEGRVENDVLLIHPQTTAWILYNGKDTEKIFEYDKEFKKDIDTLESKHRLFNLGDELLIEKYGKVIDNEFVIGEQRYKTVVLPKHIKLFDNTEKLLKEFEKNGGIVTTAEDIESFDIIDNPNITFTKRIFDNFDLYYFVNSSNSPQPANITKGTCILNKSTGEKEKFTNQLYFEPSDGIIVLDYKNGAIIDNAVTDENQTSKIDISGEWEITKIDQNILTLDFCKCYFDGKLIDQKLPVTSIQNMACDLGRKVNINMEFDFLADYIPDNISLVCETPEKFLIKVNGKPLKQNISGYFKDKSFKTISLKDYIIKGKNTIEVSCDFEQSKETYESIKKAALFESEINKLTYDTEIENIYLIGDFSLKTSGNFETLSRNAVRYAGDFVISEPKKSVFVNNIEKQGYPFFSGEISLKKTIWIDNPQSFVFELSQKNSNVVFIKVNGKEIDSIMWKPYKLDIAKYLKEGNNAIEITLVNSLRNMLGPHHCEWGESYEVRPNLFFKEKTIWGSRGNDLWNDGYCFAEFGIK